MRLEQRDNGRDKDMNRKTKRFNLALARNEDVRELLVLIKAARIASVGITTGKGRGNLWAHLNEIAELAEEELTTRNAWVPDHDYAHRAYCQLPSMID
jgi:hypothetical protein